MKEKILNKIKEKETVFQNQLWKELDLDSRKCSKIVRELEEQDLVKREWANTNGSRTYKIEYNGNKDPHSTLIAGQEIAPCAVCEEECTPEYCRPLDKWVSFI
ncbi:MAG: RNA polymerase III subunit C34, Lrp/AsnC family [Candidatus Methanohalarchaeum thermophilum]|uniref:RNA polymerase III subunit C34, Lrp/AsnC family n=1 Tax=Methanohalarchaeum thermophilum TaxID=1903181 RepID=A0A1Q6DS30_METT1|nr:MAG: RNA polymerase III subunit C34, Lrp/AsnC family [Candidatus Methanohalarchaeum thermophilum]